MIIRQRGKADYHCLDPWAAEISDKWPGGVEVIIRYRLKEHGRRKISEAAIAERRLVSEIF